MRRLIKKIEKEKKYFYKTEKGIIRISKEDSKEIIGDSRSLCATCSVCYCDKIKTQNISKSSEVEEAIQELNSFQIEIEDNYGKEVKTVHKDVGIIVLRCKKYKIFKEILEV